MNTYQKELAIAIVANAYGLSPGEVTELLSKLGAVDEEKREMFSLLSTGILVGLNMNKNRLPV